ncbi:methyltransferase domain-containing protein [Paenibacillus sp. CAU 1782]
MSTLPNEDIMKFYDSHDSIWPEGDNWHKYTKEQLIKFVNVYINKIKPKGHIEILNAGSGGSTYNLKHEMHHVDITEKHISHFKNHTVANIEDMPFENNTFDVAICVGSVLNYCDASKCINELSRVLSPKGYLILEFENSWSMEFYKTPIHKRSSDLATTKYFGSEHQLWVYSISYISQILKQHQFKILDSKRFHILSSFAYKYYQDENKAARFCKTDPFFRLFPFLSKRSHNIFLFCEKR